MGLISLLLDQCRQPHGRVGRFMAREMNRAHGPMTAWVLTAVPTDGARRVLDLGCGGGGAIGRLAVLLPGAQLHGIDYSVESVLVAQRVNGSLVTQGRAFITRGSVSALPYDEGQFDLALAIESHYFWPDVPADLVHVRRVLSGGGRLIIGGGMYLGGRRDALNRRLALAGAMNCHTLRELAEILAGSGYSDIVTRENERKGWFCVAGTKLLGDV
jgi:SAM-dependent methyltransferase